MKEFTEKNLEEVINKQFEINGYDVTYQDVKEGKMDTDELMWFQKYTTVNEKEKEFTVYLENYLSEFVPKGREKKEADKFIGNYGLKLGKK